MYFDIINFVKKQHEFLCIEFTLTRIAPYIMLSSKKYKYTLLTIILKERRDSWMDVDLMGHN